ncbi:MAG TPA: cytochrome c-type biogenesis protein CcmH [Gemmatimonadaceae bacterium]
MLRRNAVAVSACLLLLSAFARAAAGQAARQDSVMLEQRTSAVASHLRCPVCQGLSIQDSPSELAQQMRGVVRDQLAAGRTPEEVKQYFTEKYGEWILLEPEAHGFNVLVYILPVAAVVVGALVVVLAVRRWSRPAPS